MKQNIIILKTGKEVARYLDIELNGYALIAVIENTEAQKIIDNEKFKETISFEYELK